MTSHSWLLQPGTIAVLDVETVLDPAAASIAGHRSGSLPSALQRISTACVLLATERPDGQWSDFSLHTFADPASEFDILMKLDELLARIAIGGALITYNGIAHDLPVLRRRCARHWMFGLPGVAAAGTMGHLDVMLRQRLGRWDRMPSLREACAGLGISTADPRNATGPAIAPDVVKCQADVVATFLLALFEMAIERGSEDVLVAGWEGLSDHLGAARPRALHLEHFRDHPLLRVARKARNAAGHESADAK